MEAPDKKQQMDMETDTTDPQVRTQLTGCLQPVHYDHQQPEPAGTHRHPSQSDDDDACDTSLHNPVDTGWSWVIMISVFVIQLVCAGMLRSFGVLFVDIQLRFQTSASTVSVIGGVESAAFSFTAVFCMSILLEVTSVRRATVIGGFIGTCGLVISFLAPTITTLFFSFSVCLGVGMGLSMAPGYILLNLYFRKKRPLATAMANTGSSIGSVAMPMVTRMLLDTYFLPGTLLMLGGVFAQIIVFGSLFTPPSDYGYRKCLRHGDDVSEAEKEIKYQPQRHTLVKKGKETQNNMTIVSESHASQDEVDQYLDLCTIEPLTKILPTIRTPPSMTNSLISVNGQQIHHPCYQFPIQKEYGLWKDRLSVDNLVLAASMGGSPAISFASLDIDMERQVYLQKGLVNITVDTLEHNDEHEDSNEQLNECSSQRSVLHVLKSLRICEPSMYRSAVFWLLAAYHFTACLVCSLPSAYLPALAQEKGLTLTQGALLLTICGALDIVSRLVPGILAQSGLLKPQTSVAVSLLVLGVTFQFTEIMEGMIAMVVMSVVYGLFSGVFFSMLQLIILDFSDLSKFRQLFSSTQLALGASGITGYPIVGCLRDMSGSYITSFHFMGACGLLAGALLLVMPSLRRREKAKAREIAAATAVSDTDKLNSVTEGAKRSG